MKKILALIILITAFSAPSVALAWDDCPFGLVDDPYPGECARYVDTDDDGICDLSQSAPGERTDDTDVATDNTDSTINPPDVEETELVETPIDLKSSPESKTELIATIVTTIIFLLAIIGYVQYKKRK